MFFFFFLRNRFSKYVVVLICLVRVVVVAKLIRFSKHIVKGTLYIVKRTKVVVELCP